jgi:hypothetical protein
VDGTMSLTIDRLGPKALVCGSTPGVVDHVVL